MVHATSTPVLRAQPILERPVATDPQTQSSTATEDARTQISLTRLSAILSFCRRFMGTSPDEIVQAIQKLLPPEERAAGLAGSVEPIGVREAGSVDQSMSKRHSALIKDLEEKLAYHAHHAERIIGHYRAELPSENLEAFCDTISLAHSKLQHRLAEVRRYAQSWNMVMDGPDEVSRISPASSTTEDLVYRRAEDPEHVRMIRNRTMTAEVYWELFFKDSEQEAASSSQVASAETGLLAPLAQTSTMLMHTEINPVDLPVSDLRALAGVDHGALQARVDKALEVLPEKVRRGFGLGQLTVSQLEGMSEAITEFRNLPAPRKVDALIEFVTSWVPHSVYESLDESEKRQLAYYRKAYAESGIGESPHRSDFHLKNLAAKVFSLHPNIGILLDQFQISAPTAASSLEEFSALVYLLRTVLPKMERESNEVLDVMIDRRLAEYERLAGPESGPVIKDRSKEWSILTSMYKQKKEKGALTANQRMYAANLVVQLDAEMSNARAEADSGNEAAL